MLSKKLRFRKNRQSRRQIAQSDLLISEVLEKRQMLSANDNIYFDVTLLDDTPITPQPVSWQTSSASYSAPWSLGLGQNGYGNQADWTSSNSLSETDGAIDLKENIIDSIEDFDDALKNQEIKEVSEDLIGVF